ncbi:MAG TPA: hypothetical protein VL944_01100 [Candidatus Acidoferrum sp.]|nr:hypothetical protein [Candidatus Acidoferrum sp.]
MKNIYEVKNARLLVLIPIAMLIVALFFIPKIQLDQTLKGGVNIQLQTNSTIDVRALTSQINSKVPGAEASVSLALGGVSITIDENASLAAATQYSTNIYGLYGNYTRASVLLASYQTSLQTEPSNSTLSALISAEAANQTRFLSQINDNLTKELGVLSAFTGTTPKYNSSDALGMVNLAQSALANASQIYQQQVITYLHQVISFTSYSYNDVTPTLGSFFLSQMRNIIIAAFVLVAICVLIIFRSPIPAMAVVFSSANDIIVALGVMGIFGIPLGVASIGGILMLIGYSIDTSLLSSIRILKRSEDTATVRAFNTMKTGITMTSAAIITFAILLIVSYISFIPTYYEISAVVLAGLIADIFTTWFGATTMVLAYKKRKEKS